MDLSARLHATEEALRISEKLALAGSRAEKALKESAIPIEILSNLIYLTRSKPDDEQNIVKYMELAEVQTKKLSSICLGALRSYRDDTAKLQSPTDPSH